MQPFFQIKTNDKTSQARTGLLNTSHGSVDTPVFMPVGTIGSVKGVNSVQLKNTGAKMMLANAYHLMLRPGKKAIEDVGGIHKFMAWKDPILTDSGGYQIFSLSKLTKINDLGVVFTSHIDGKTVELTPESAVDNQIQLGSNIIMCLDQCTPFPCDNKLAQKAVKRTINWAIRCKQACDNAKTSSQLFTVLQGATNLNLREKCAKSLVDADFTGYAIGGLGVGEGHEKMLQITAHATALLPKNKPRYLMGIGTPLDIIQAVRMGIDMFDCVLPTRNGRNAYAFTETGPLRLRNSVHANDPRPVEPGCQCQCCRNYSRAAIRHFFKSREMLGPILLSIHNLHFYQRLMNNIRKHINEGSFKYWANEKIRKYKKLVK